MVFIPIIIGLVASTTSAAGIVTGITGLADLRLARELAERAARRLEDARERQELAAESLEDAVERYEHACQKVRSETFSRLVALLDKLGKRATIRLKYGGRVELSIEQPTVAEYRSSVLEVDDAVGLLGAAAAGSSLSGGVVSLVSAFGVASTGTAISTLSGAAASNAALAALGGGAVAVGGGGVALGTVMLGGLVAGPAITVGGLTLANKGEKTLTEAHRYASEVEVAVVKLDVYVALLEHVERRVDELYEVVTELDQRLNEQLARLEESFDPTSDSDVGRLSMAIQLARELRDIMGASILNRPYSQS